MGLCYQWSLDFADPLNLTPRHNRYVLVMIEHISKWLELMPLLDRNNEGVAYAFLEKMCNKFGALVKVLTDQGMEF
jgi:hypothetical protein